MKLWTSRLLALVFLFLSGLSMPCLNCEAQAHKQEKQTHSCCQKQAQQASHKADSHNCRTGCCQQVASPQASQACQDVCTLCCPQPCSSPTNSCCLHPEQAKAAQHWRPLLIDASPRHNMPLYLKYRQVRT